jgi:hypothetical protein
VERVDRRLSRLSRPYGSPLAITKPRSTKGGGNLPQREPRALRAQFLGGLHERRVPLHVALAASHLPLAARLASRAVRSLATYSAKEPPVWRIMTREAFDVRCLVAHDPDRAARWNAAGRRLLFSQRTGVERQSTGSTWGSRCGSGGHVRRRAVTTFSRRKFSEPRHLRGVVMAPA